MAAYLEKLNDRQREAVEHGVGLAGGAVGGPLLIIAGAGSGKTNTLAHRVAHLIVNGADPRRILHGLRGIRGEVYLHRSCVRLEEADLSTAADRGQLDLWPNECEGMCGV